MKMVSYFVFWVRGGNTLFLRVILPNTDHYQVSFFLSSKVQEGFGALCFCLHIALVYSLRTVYFCDKHGKESWSMSIGYTCTVVS